MHTVKDWIKSKLRPLHSIIILFFIFEVLHLLVLNVVFTFWAELSEVVWTESLKL